MGRRFVLLCLFLPSVVTVGGARRPGHARGHRKMTEDDMGEVVRYLKRYGYMDAGLDFGRPADAVNDPRLSASLRRMQAFFHLPATGRPSRRTVEMMGQARCGCPDVAPGDRESGADAGAVRGELPLSYRLAGRLFRWTRTDISFQFLNYPSGPRALPPAEVRRIVGRAFRLWSDVVPLTFREVGDPSRGGADVRIQFGRGHHHPDELSLTSFDGPGGELAHAFPPNSFRGELEGDIHFDDDELFTADGREGWALLLVAAHEIGHSLGLAHSDDPASLMWPNYRYVPVRGYRLPADDVRGIQAIYGPRVGGSPRPVSDGATAAEPRRAGGDASRPPGKLSSMCEKPFAALLKVDDELFAFRDNMVWRIRIRDRRLLSPPSGEPAKMFWKGMPVRITAAYQRQDGSVVFFKGTKYYVYNGKRRAHRPGHISSMEIARPPMAALRAGRQATSKVYLLRGGQAWLYDEATGSVDAGYPRDAREVWADLPAGVTAGVTLDDGTAVFLKGDRYFEVGADKRVTSRRGSQSRLFSVDFLGCPAPV